MIENQATLLPLIFTAYICNICSDDKNPYINTHKLMIIFLNKRTTLSLLCFFVNLDHFLPCILHTSKSSVKFDSEF